jgi:replication factor C subunit 1
LNPPLQRTASGLCFEGLKIAVTGVFESCSREGIEDLILTHGGKVAGAVSGKTNYLVAGNLLEDGRPAQESSKYKNAVEKKVQILSETELLELIAVHEAKQGSVKQEESQSSMTSADSSGVTTQATTSSVGLPPNPFARSGAASSAAPVRTATYTGAQNSSSCSGGNPFASRPGGSASSASSAAQLQQQADLLWVDKYRPQSSAGMIGSTEIVSKLTNWLRRYNSCIARGLGSVDCAGPSQ